MGGASRFARIHRLKPAEAQKILEKDLAYTLHRPRRRGRFPKTGIVVTEASKKILKRAEGRTPQRLETDDGKEFYNHTFQKLMKDKDIHHFSTTGDTKASVVERFDRTLKSRMYRYFTSANTYKYLNILQALVKGYNESFHRGIGMKASEVTLESASDV